MQYKQDMPAAIPSIPDLSSTQGISYDITSIIVDIYSHNYI